MGDCGSLSSTFQASVPEDYEDGAAGILAEILGTNVCTRTLTNSFSSTADVHGEKWGTDVGGSFGLDMNGGYSEVGCGALTPIIEAFKTTKEQISCIVNKVVQNSSNTDIVTNTINIVVKNNPVVGAAMYCRKLPMNQGKFIQKIDGKRLNVDTFNSTVINDIKQQLDTLVNTVIEGTASNTPGFLSTTGDATAAAAGITSMRNVQNGNILNDIVQNIVNKTFVENEVNITYYNLVGPIPDINQSILIDILATKMVGSTLKTIVEKWTSSENTYDYSLGSNNSPSGLDDIAASGLNLAFVTSFIYLLGVGAITGVSLGTLFGMSTNFTTWGMLLALGIICVVIGVVTVATKSYAVSIACGCVGLGFLGLSIYFKNKSEARKASTTNNLGTPSGSPP